MAIRLILENKDFNDSWEYKIDAKNINVKCKNIIPTCIFWSVFGSRIAQMIKYTNGVKIKVCHL